MSEQKYETNENGQVELVHPNGVHVLVPLSSVQTWLDLGHSVPDDKSKVDLNVFDQLEEQKLAEQARAEQADAQNKEN